MIDREVIDSYKQNLNWGDWETRYTQADLTVRLTASTPMAPPPVGDKEDLNQFPIGPLKSAQGERQYLAGDRPIGVKPPPVSFFHACGDKFWRPAGEGRVACFICKIKRSESFLAPGVKIYRQRQRREYIPLNPAKDCTASRGHSWRSKGICSAKKYIRIYCPVCKQTNRSTI